MKAVVITLYALTMHSHGPLFVKDPGGPVHEYEQQTNVDHHRVFGLACLNTAKVPRFALMTDGQRLAVEPVWPGAASLRFAPGRELSSDAPISVSMVDEKKHPVSDARCFVDWTGTTPDLGR